MANTSAIWQQAAHTTYQLSSPCCSTRAIPTITTTIKTNKQNKKTNNKTNYFLIKKNTETFFGGKKSGEWTISRKNDNTERAKED